MPMTLLAGAPNPGLVPDRLRGLAGDAVGAEDEEAVEGAGEPAVVGDGEDGALVGLQAVLESLGRFEVQVVGGLVEEQGRRALELQQQDLEAGLLAAGEVAEPLVALALQLIAAKHAHRGAAVAGVQVPQEDRKSVV